jgi:hypothetical protein
MDREERDYQAEGLVLAIRLEEVLEGANTIAVLYACSWVLASLIRTAKRDGQAPEKSLALIVRLIENDLAELAMTEAHPERSTTRH